MARRNRAPVHHCRSCRLERLPDETFHNGFCPACSERNGKGSRRRVGSALLARAKTGGAIERDGRTFQVVTLPPEAEAPKALKRPAL